LKKISVILTVIMIIIYGCTNRSDHNLDKDEAFNALYPNVEFNEEIRLEEDPSAPNNHIIGSEVDLVLYNFSDEEIEFSISTDLDIYQYDLEKNNWKQIENLFNYRGPSQILPPMGSPGITDAFALSWPNLIDNGTPIQIRIVAIGTVVEDKNLRIGDYYDIELIPYENSDSN
jgi:hypothetical protein